MNATEFEGWAKSPPRHYGWEHFHGFNGVARELLEPIGVTYLDIREMTVRYRNGMPGSYEVGTVDQPSYQWAFVVAVWTGCGCVVSRTA
jgi:hypothetical protein